MADYGNFLIIFSYVLILNFFFNKLDILKDKKNLSPHKSFTNTELNPPFSGGIILLITILIFFPHENLQFKIFILLVFFIGFFSDLNILKSPNLRFLIQLIIVLCFVFYSENFIQSVRIEFLDNLFENYLIKLFFTSFCILILINGSNFIDGVNTLTIGYYLLVLIFISLVLNDFQIQQSTSNLLNILMFTLVLLFVLNFFELLYLGDNGAYLLSFLVGIFLIDISNQIILISPYYIMNLLWFPAYENLFSIIRKIKNKKSAFNPDNYHLHHLILIYLKNRLKNIKLANSLTGCSINSYNLFIFYFATINYSNTKHQLLLSFFSLIIYNVLYITLKKIIKKMY
tara:strand:+ start:693 stop:1721 length:1029 start_codon:yes stop_codon:yes gene_type:complete